MIEADPARSDAHTPTHKHEAKSPRPNDAFREDVETRLRVKSQPREDIARGGKDGRAAPRRTSRRRKRFFLASDVFLVGGVLPLGGVLSVTVLSDDIFPVGFLSGDVLLVDVPVDDLRIGVFLLRVLPVDVLFGIFPVGWTPPDGVSGLLHSGT